MPGNLTKGARGDSLLGPEGVGGEVGSGRKHAHGNLTRRARRASLLEPAGVGEEMGSCTS